MFFRWLAAVLVLPGNVLLVIPGLILYLSRNTRWAYSLAATFAVEFWLAFFLGLCGMVLAVWTVTLFSRFGQGTAAPWDPPQKFVVRGPYRHVRNPMITGAFLILLSESLFLRSWLLFGWFLIFFLGNSVYIPLVEEKGLQKRFGDDYIVYQRHVPRWIPRLTPWTPGQVPR